MAKSQFSVSRVGELGRILTLARQVYPSAESDAELVRRIAETWEMDRRENGKGKRIDALTQKLDSMSRDVLALTIMLGQVEALLSAVMQTLSELKK